MNAVVCSLHDFIVVDANADDFEPLVRELDESQRASQFSTGEAVLCEAAPAPGATWLVNSQLPDMPGAALVNFIKRGERRARVIVVADEYSLDDELAARAAGAAAYLCKPVSAAWLDFGRSAPMPTIRASPPFW